MERNLRKERVGVVVSNKMEKTIVVAVRWKEKHPSIKLASSMFMTRRMRLVSEIPYASWRPVL